MNREIKFRGIKKDSNNFIYGWLVNNKNGELAMQMKLSWDLYEIVKGTEGQYTGLNDKNGKEIWQGDRFNAWGVLNEVVIFEDGAFRDNTYKRALYLFRDVEIIGHIHE